MKKKQDKKRHNKIIPFPDLVKRLLAKGLDCLQQKNFQEAIRYLKEAREIEPENADIQFGLILAYFESGLLQNAKELANSMLKKGIGNYIEIIDLYLTILIQLHEYDEIVATIEVLLEEKEVPKEKYEHFSSLLEFSRRMSESSSEIEVKETQTDDLNVAKLNLFSNQDQKELTLLIAQLAEKNIKPYLEEIILYLQSEEGHPFLKTMLLNILTEHGYNQAVTVSKLGKKISVIPDRLEHIDQHPQMQGVLKLLEIQLGHKDPILYDSIKSLIKRHFFIMYPFRLGDEEDSAWAASYHSLVNDYYGIASSYMELASIYGVHKDDLEKTEEFIRRLEKISYPNI